MSRIDLGKVLLPSVVAVGLLAACGGEETNFQWFTDRGDLAHTAGINESIEVPLEERWRVDLGAAIRSPVSGEFGKLFVGTDDGTMFALDPADGSVLWSFEADAAISVTATLAAEGKEGDRFVWFVSEVGTLYALDAEDGSELWTVAGEGSAFNSPTNYRSGAIYYTFASLGGSSTLRAVSGTTGVVMWEATGLGTSIGTPSIAAERVFLGLNTEGIVFKAFESGTGEIDWQVADLLVLGAGTRTSGVVDLDVPIGDPLRIFMSPQNGRVNARLVANGNLLWETELSPPGAVRGMALTQNRDPNILVVSHQLRTLALDPDTGEQLWQVQVESSPSDLIGRAPLPAIYGDYVFHIEGGDRLVARKLGDGSDAWSIELDAVTSSSPTVGGQTVYIGTGSGSLYAFSPPA